MGLRNFLSKAFGRASESKGFLTSAEAFEVFAATVSESGIHLSTEIALRVPAVLAATKAISEGMGQLPIGLYRCDPKSGDKLVEPADHPVAHVLRQPAPWVGESEFRRIMQADVLLTGNAYAVVVKVDGEPRELYRIDPRLVSVTYDIYTAQPHYRVGTAEDGAREYQWNEMLHLRALGTNGATGIGITTLAREAICLALVLEQHASRLFSRGAKPAGVIETDKTLGDGAIKKIQQSFETMFGGSAGSGKTAVLEEGMKFKQQQLSSVDAQFIELRDFAVLEIARACRVPPHMVGALDKTTHSNVSELNDTFLMLTLMPWCDIWTDALERTLLTDDERDQFCIQFDTNSFTRADIETRFNAYKTALESGVMLLNEVRGLEGLPPVPGGDVPMRSIQSVPLSSVAPSTEEAGTKPNQPALRAVA